MMAILDTDISINQSFSDWEEAINYSGELLVAQGYVTPKYTQAMMERQKNVSVYMGNFVALPHGEIDNNVLLKEGLGIIQVPDGVNFGTKEHPKIATLLFPIAFQKETQLEVLQELAFFCSDIDNVMALSDAETIEQVREIIDKFELFK